MKRKAFTLIELLVVMGLIALLTSLLLPVVSKVRGKARSTACLANLRQFGISFVVYTSQNQGKLVQYQWLGRSPDDAWNGYWFAITENGGIREASLLCPSALEPLGVNFNKGFGTADAAWTGFYQGNSTVVRVNSTNYRTGSYGYNRFFTASLWNGQGTSGGTTKLSMIRELSEVPMLMDCAFADTFPVNGTPGVPAQSPVTLQGNLTQLTSPDQFKFLLARHGRAINIAFADGSARTVPLEETYRCIWHAQWIRYSLPLVGR